LGRRTHNLDLEVGGMDQPGAGISWTSAEADAATATGVAPSCVWCGVPIGRDPNDGWVHITRAYACRDPQGGWMRSTAQPRPTFECRILPVTGRRGI
jgi:hypothetical protein